MGVPARISAIFLTFLGAVLALGTGHGVENGWSPVLAMMGVAATLLFLIPGLLLCWRAFPRGPLLDFLLVFAGAGLAYLLLYRFGSSWEDYERHYHQQQTISALVGTAVVMACATFPGLDIGRRANARLGWHRVSGPWLLACAIASAIAIHFVFKVLPSSGSVGWISAIAILVILPALTVVAMSLFLGTTLARKAWTIHTEERN
jgi:hypothetical protein